MNRYLLLILILSLSFCARKKAIISENNALSTSTGSAATVAQQSLWKELSPDQYRSAITSDTGMPKKFRMFSLDSVVMRTQLLKSVNQNQWMKGDHDLTLEFPRPDTGFSIFSIYETSVMDSALAAHYPYLKTYAGQRITDHSESVRFDFNENGFNAYITGVNGEWFIQPLRPGITHQFLLIFYKKDMATSSKTPFELPDSLRK